MFAEIPVLHANGSLGFTLAAKAFGTATLTVVLRDDAGKSLYLHKIITL